MKVSTLFLAFALTFLFISHSLGSRAIFDDNIVYDVQGYPLVKGASYLISPPIWGPLGSDVALAKRIENNETCVQDVIQLWPEVLRGDPFTFTPTVVPIGEEDHIKLGATLAIQSPGLLDLCEESSIWKVSSETGIPVPIITTGGFFNTPNSCLRIVKSDMFGTANIYMIEHCPFLCGAGFRMCRSIGIYNVNTGGQRHLSTGGVAPFNVVFTRVPIPVNNM